MRRRCRSHDGQILIVVAVGMVVLIGIAAIAIDLGFAWMMRRQAQNAVDPAAVAARDEATWFMDYRNSDGSLSEMCGNGVRVLGRYLVTRAGASYDEQRAGGAAAATRWCSCTPWAPTAACGNR